MLPRKKGSFAGVEMKHPQEGAALSARDTAGASTARKVETGGTCVERGSTEAVKIFFLLFSMGVPDAYDAAMVPRRLVDLPVGCMLERRIALSLRARMWLPFTSSRISRRRAAFRSTKSGT
jgi:hypothetical protein